MLSKIKSVIHHTFLAKTHPSPLLYIVAAVMLAVQPLLKPTINTHAVSCPDLKIIYARGSGAPQDTSTDYQTFKSSMETKLRTTSLSYEIEDLYYPAVSISIADGHLGTMLGAYISGGDAYDFGDSVHIGVEKLLQTVNNTTCKNTKYVLAGYSQGAIVLLNGIEKIDSDKIIYVATFGDPKIYLPEGAGLIPAACRGKNLSDYRIYVPDCYTYKGILGARDPYVISEYLGKIGTWCNKRDILCSAHYNISDHTHYAADGLYEDASRLIFSKIASAFGFQNEYTSPHDTAILIDSSGSMTSLIDEYKQEAMRLAEKTLNAGGRVALYDYRDLDDPYRPVERCNFETCTLETFQTGLNQITADNGGDEPESLLSASMHVMQSLNWKLGSTKSLVILTDAGYHSPDLDGTTFYDVKALSKQIDPVNFYIITTPDNLATYQSLAEATDGAVASTVDDLSTLTDAIVARYDSLPRVEELLEVTALDTPHLEITNVKPISNSEYQISFNNNTDKTVVILNDAILGVTDRTEITLFDLDPNQTNTLTLVPLSATIRGETVSIQLNYSHVANEFQQGIIIPKAPDTGRQ